MVRKTFFINRLSKSGDHESNNQTSSGVKTFFTRLVQRKTITQLQAEAEGNNELKRTLTTFQLLALGIGSIIGKMNESSNDFEIELND